MCLGMFGINCEKHSTKTETGLVVTTQAKAKHLPSTSTAPSIAKWLRPNLPPVYLSQTMWRAEHLQADLQTDGHSRHPVIQGMQKGNVDVWNHLCLCSGKWRQDATTPPTTATRAAFIHSLTLKRSNYQHLLALRGSALRTLIAWRIPS